MKPVAWMLIDKDWNDACRFFSVPMENAIPLYTAPRELSRSDIYGLAMEAGFMLSTQYGQAEDKLMPVTDGETLMKLAELILKKASNK
jgi:hypothetical protein